LETPFTPSPFGQQLPEVSPGFMRPKVPFAPHPSAIRGRIAEEPISAAHHQGLVHTHRNGVDIGIRPGLRSVEIGDGILVFPQEAMRAGIASNGKAYQIAIVRLSPSLRRGAREGDFRNCRIP